jgi:glutathione synthase/RimK-type ligase-like ATP-grasp enzyme
MIAIQKAKGGFDKRWISYCLKNEIRFKLVDCYRNDIISQLKDCNAFLWQFYQGSLKGTLMAKQLIYSLEHIGIKVFPDFNTNWHFDDKVGQKYLLESIGAPLVPTYIFYDKKEAYNWAENACFPKVFKLRRGAGSSNVRLVKSTSEAKRLISKAFGNGFSQYKKIDGFKERLRRYRQGNGSLTDIVKGAVRFVYPSEYVRNAGNECGYIYFQDFVPGNDHDIRVIVIGEKAFAIKRMVRVNDFRASGSGLIYYDRELFDEELIKLAFDLAGRLESQCVAFDFIYKNKIPLVVEISYGFSPEGYDSCPGFWDKDITWHTGEFDPYGWIIENLVGRG